MILISTGVDSNANGIFKFNPPRVTLIFNVTVLFVSFLISIFLRISLYLYQCPLMISPITESFKISLAPLNASLTSVEEVKLLKQANKSLILASLK